MISVERIKVGFEGIVNTRKCGYVALLDKENRVDEICISEILYGTSRTPSATLDERARFTSFMEYSHIKKAYGEVLGLHGIDHFSINIVPSSGKMLIFSIRPNLAHTLYRNQSGLAQDLAISPLFYENLDQYFWDDCYNPNTKHLLLEKKEKLVDLKDGAVFVHRESDVTYMLSFGTKGDKDKFRQDIKLNPAMFRSAGLYCLELMSNKFCKYLK